jgi:hypothetical protein
MDVFAPDSVSMAVLFTSELFIIDMVDSHPVTAVQG